MKQTIILVLFSFLVLTGYSQIVYGVKAGLNMSTFTGNDIESPKFHPSFHVGGFVNFLLTEKITIQPELMFSGKGAKSDAATYNLGYVILPVLVQYNDPSGFFAEVGPQAGLIVTAKEKTSGGSTIDIKKTLKSEDFSWVFGLGYKMTNGFGIGARYDFGFHDIANSGIIRNKTIMLSVFYTFGTSYE